MQKGFRAPGAVSLGSNLGAATANRAPGGFEHLRVAYTPNMAPYLLLKGLGFRV